MANPLSPETMAKLEAASTAEEKLVEQRVTVRTLSRATAQAQTEEMVAKTELLTDQEAAIAAQKAAIDAVIADLEIESEETTPQPWSD